MEQADALEPRESQLRQVCRYTLLIGLATIVVVSIVRIQLGARVDFSAYLAVAGLDPMNTAGFTALFVAFLGCRPSRQQIAYALVLALLGELLFLSYAVSDEVRWIDRLPAIGGGTGMAGMLFMIGMRLQEKEPTQRRRIEAWLLAGSCLLLFPTLMGQGLGTLSDLTPRALDGHAYPFEGSLGFYPAQIVAKFLLYSPYLLVVVMSIYGRLPLWAFLATWLSVKFPKRVYTNVFLAFLLGGLLPLPFYALLPMVGIDLYVGTPPWPLLELPTPKGDFSAVLAPINYPRTCFPSMHAAWITLVYFSVARISWKFRTAGLFLWLFTMLGALSAPVGHYTIDLLVGIPFGLTLVAIATPQTQNNKAPRLLAILYGIAMVAGWGMLFRWYPELPNSFPQTAWSLLTLSCLATFPLESRLAAKSLSRNKD